MSRTIQLHFHECEHDGDLNTYLEDVQECKTVLNIVSTEINHEAETGDVYVEITNIDDFIEEFKGTYACDFSNYSHY